MRLRVFCGSGLSPTGFAASKEERRPEGRPTRGSCSCAFPVGRASARRVSLHERKSVGLKADPQGAHAPARFLWVGLQPDRGSALVGRASARLAIASASHALEERRPEGRPTGSSCACASPVGRASMRRAVLHERKSVGLKADPQGAHAPARLLWVGLQCDGLCCMKGKASA